MDCIGALTLYILNIDLLDLGYDFINIKSKLLVFCQFIFMIKHVCYTCTLRGNDTSRTEYGYNNMISRHFNIFLPLHNLCRPMYMRRRQHKLFSTVTQLLFSDTE